MAAGEAPQKIVAESQAHQIEPSDASGFGTGAFFGGGGYGRLKLLSWDRNIDRQTGHLTGRFSFTTMKLLSSCYSGGSFSTRFTGE
jgi:hypothetical protein